MAERHGRILAELAGLSLSIARELEAAVVATEDPSAKAELAAAFHAVARSVRQTLALEARLQRQAREAGKEDARVRRIAVDARKQQVRAAVERLIDRETEGEAAERLSDDLEALLDADELDPGLLAETVQAHVVRVCRMLGLAPPAPASSESTHGWAASGAAVAEDAPKAGDRAAAQGAAPAPAWRSSG